MRYFALEIRTASGFWSPLSTGRARTKPDEASVAATGVVFRNSRRDRSFPMEAPSGCDGRILPSDLPPGRDIMPPLVTSWKDP